MVSQYSFFRDVIKESLQTSPVLLQYWVCMTGRTSTLWSFNQTCSHSVIHISLECWSNGFISVFKNPQGEKWLLATSDAIAHIFFRFWSTFTWSYCSWMKNGKADDVRCWGRILQTWSVLFVRSTANSPCHSGAVFHPGFLVWDYWTFSHFCWWNSHNTATPILHCVLSINFCAAASTIIITY